MATRRRARVVINPPSHNGCRTCRTRRVKCDEGRPSCQRCIRSGWTCDGYAHVKDTSEALRSVAPNGPSTRDDDRPCGADLFSGGAMTAGGSSTGPASAPRDSHDVFTRPNEIATRIGFEHTLSPSMRSMCFPFQITDHERHGWSYFQHNTFRPLSEISLGATWIQAAVQCARTTEPVFHAVTALGSAHRSTDFVLDWYLERWDQPKDRTIAIAQYGRALASLRTLVSNMSSAGALMDAFLVTCMLCVCYEGMVGQSANAISHMALGRSIMMVRGNRASIPKGRLFNELALKVDATLEVDAMPLLLKTPSSSMTTTSSLPVLPSMFTDLSEAELHLMPLLNHASSCRQRILELAESRIKRSSVLPSCHVVQNVLGSCASRDMLSTYRSLSQSVEGIMIGLQRWDAAMSCFLLDNSSAKTRHTALLQIRHAHTVLMLRLLTDKDDTVLDQYKTAMSNLLDFAQTYLSLTPSYPPSPTPRSEDDTSICRGGSCIDTRIIPAIHFVAVKCRHPNIRRRAVRLLATMDRREALHSSLIVASTAAAIVTLEEDRARESQAAASGSSSVHSSRDEAQSIERADQVPKGARFSEGVFVSRPGGSVEIWCGSWVRSIDTAPAIEVRRYLAQADWCGKDEHELAANLATGEFSLACFGEVLIDGVYVM